MNEETKICPICKKPNKGIGALSRKDNKTEICSECGTREALQNYYAHTKELSIKNKK